MDFALCLQEVREEWSYELTELTGEHEGFRLPSSPHKWNVLWNSSTLRGCLKAYQAFVSCHYSLFSQHVLLLLHAPPRLRILRVLKMRCGSKGSGGGAMGGGSCRTTAQTRMDEDFLTRTLFQVSKTSHVSCQVKNSGAIAFMKDLRTCLPLTS